MAVSISPNFAIFFKSNTGASFCLFSSLSVLCLCHARSHECVCVFACVCIERGGVGGVVEYDKLSYVH